MLDKLEPILENYVPAKDCDIQEIEELTNVRLPEAYIEFVKKYGRSTFGGYAKVISDKTEFSIFTWFGGGNGDGSIIEDIKAHEDYSHQGIIPIADDIFNNRFIINGSNGEISFIEYSSGSAEIIKVANSFEDFISNIQVEEDE